MVPAAYCHKKARFQRCSFDAAYVVSAVGELACDTGQGQSSDKSKILYMMNIAQHNEVIAWASKLL